MSRLSSFPSIRSMAAPAAALSAVLMLAACGQNDAAPAADSAPQAPKTPTPTEAEKIALLAALPSPYNEGDLDNGRRAFARCRSCHTITPGGPNMTGPNLFGVFGSKAWAKAKYRYTHAMRTAGITLDSATLTFRMPH